MAKPEARRVSLREFLDEDALSDVVGREALNLVAQINGGSFMQCHREIFAATGVWIDELVPVFQKLDMALVTRDVRPELK